MISGIMATAIFVRDLARCTAFYRDTLKLPYAWSDADSSTFHLQGQILTLISVPGAADLLGSDPNTLKIDGATRVVLAAGVEDVDAVYEALSAEGVTFLRPPTDQPWEMRTAHFADPEGNIWEINQPMKAKAEE
ncbi:MAG TPA: VOC family protein [Ktedonosporobacter sp.]|nr:VOC family protein [Ktedonosporobacter sp.]